MDTDYSLRAKILSLISKKKEGVYWDFKLKHHNHPVDLVHDIICLANATGYQGDRFLIFGVDPKTCEIVGIEDINLNRQVEIIDTLCNASFASGYIPAVRLLQLSVDEKNIEILVVKDIAQKPFYLSKEYKKSKRALNAGTIYSRIEDRNTAKNSVAPSSKIEDMWRQRFSLDLHPMERAKLYLEDTANWESLEHEIYYYKPYPEYTICFGDEGTEAGLGHDRWARACINDSLYYYSIELKYHQTVLWRDHTASIDGSRVVVVAPDFHLDHFSDNNDIFYYYLYDSMKRRVNDFLSDTIHQSNNPYSLDALQEHSVMFRNEKEYYEFLNYLSENELPEYTGHVRQTGHDFINETLLYCKRVSILFDQFRRRDKDN